MDKNILIIFLTLGLFTVQILWIITEPRPLKERFTKQITITYFLETLIVLLQIVSAIYFPWPQTPWDSYIVLFGVLIYLLGIALATWAKFIMNQNWGVPGELEGKRQKNLVIKGPFQFSRNPIYLGLSLMFFGYSIALRSWFIFLRFPLLYYFYKSIKKEEKLLEKQYGEEYLKYKSRVPKVLLF